MKGFKLTELQKNEIHEEMLDEQTVFNCVQDINEDWFLFLSKKEIELIPKQFAYLNEIDQVDFVVPEAGDLF